MKSNAMNSLPEDQNESQLERLTPFLVMAWLILFWILYFTSPLPNASNAERTIDRLDVVVLLPEIYADLLTPIVRPTASSSLLNLGQRVDVLAVAIAILCCSIAAGRLLLRSVRLFDSLDRCERFALGSGAGLSAVSLATLGLGICGLLSGVLFWALIAATCLLEFWVTLRAKNRETLLPSIESTQLKTPSAPGWLKWLILGICIPFVCCMLLGSLLPPTDFDVKEYHLGGPKEYFQAGRVKFLPHDVYTSFPFLTEMLSLLGMVLRGDWERGAYAGQAVLMAFAPLTALGVFCSTRRLAGSSAAWLAALIYLTIPWTYRISIIAYTEGALCCYVVLSMLAFQLWRSTTRHQSSGLGAAQCTGRNELLLLGFLAGSAVSTKYPGMILVAIPFALAVAFESTCLRNRRWVSLFWNLLFYGLGVVLAFGPWMAKNLMETGNPVYPLLYGLFGGVDWNPQMHAKWQAAHPPGMLAGSWDDFAGVFYKNDWQSPLLFGLAPLALLHRNRREVLGVLAYAAVLLAGWYLLTHRIDRFWVPMNSVMAVLAGCGLATAIGTDRWLAVSPRVSSTRQKKMVAPISDSSPATSLVRWLIIVLVAGSVFYQFGFITTPLCGYNAYLSTYILAEEQTKTQSVKIVDWLTLPSGSKVLFVGEAELFNADFPYAYNTVFDENLLEEWTSTETAPGVWELKSADEIRKKFHSEQITHLFINWNEILRYRTTYGYTDFVTPNRIAQLQNLGVISPISLPDSIQLRAWKGVDASWQNNIEQKVPELKKTIYGEPVMLQYQCFKVEYDGIAPVN